MTDYVSDEGLLHLAQTRITQEYGYGAGAHVTYDEESGRFAFNVRDAAEAALENAYGNPELANPHFKTFVDESARAYNEANDTSLSPQEYMKLATQAGGPDLVIGYEDWLGGNYSLELPEGMRPASAFGYTAEISESLTWGEGAKVWETQLTQLNTLLREARTADDSGTIGLGAAQGVIDGLNASVAALAEAGVTFREDGAAVVRNTDGQEVIVTVAQFAAAGTENEALSAALQESGLSQQDIDGLLGLGDQFERVASTLDLDVNYVADTALTATRGR